MFFALEAPQLVDVRAESGIEFVHESGDPEKRTILSSLGGGAALFDYDGDADLDVYLVRKGANQLYRNSGGFRFENVTEDAGVSATGWSIGCAAADFDNDGLADLYVTRIGPDVLYRSRGDGTFEDVSSILGGGTEGFGASAAFFDAEGDGDLDLYVANYVAPDQTFPEPGTDPTCQWLGLAVMCGPRGLVGQKDVFYRNEGLRFVEASEENGLDDSIQAYGIGVVSSDYDADRDADLYVANDTNPNFLFRNDGEGRFEEVGLLSGAAYSGAGATQAGMGVDFGDANGDGHLDIFVTNFSHETNTLYVGSSSGLFTDETEEVGLSTPSLGPLGWGTRFVDLDNDGDEDLFVANGHVYPGVESVDATTSYRQQNQIFLNDGRGSFTEAAWSAEAKSNRGAAFGDLDRDGDPDVVVSAIDGRPSILRNDFAVGARFIGLVLVGRESNRDGAGARVHLRSASRAQVKEAHASGSVLSSNDPRLLFGLGASKDPEIEVRWPSGAQLRLGAVPVDRYVVVVEGVEGFIETPGTSTSP
jgi:enediyne biosynthesis protein E4